MADAPSVEAALRTGPCRRGGPGDVTVIESQRAVAVPEQGNLVRVRDPPPER